MSDGMKAGLYIVSCLLLLGTALILAHWRDENLFQEPEPLVVCVEYLGGPEAPCDPHFDLLPGEVRVES